MTIPPGYTSQIEACAGRILALIPEHPEIMLLTDAFDLFKVPGFTTDGLELSLAQAMGALALAKGQWRKRLAIQLAEQAEETIRILRHPAVIPDELQQEETNGGRVQPDP